MLMDTFLKLKPTVSPIEFWSEPGGTSEQVLVVTLIRADIIIIRRFLDSILSDEINQEHQS